MQLGMIGLGRMGANIVRRLMRDGHSCVVYDVSPDAVAALVAEGATARPRSTTSSPGSTAAPGVDDGAGRGDHGVDGDGLAARLGAATRSSTAATRTTGTTSAARPSSHRGIRYVDCGTSGGVFGLERGYCLMVGGPDDAFAELEPIFASLAPGVETAERTPGRDGEPAPEERGYLHCGQAGAGTS